ncbi:ABC transporter permease [Kitasatospora sp. NPDC057223]|uniref:ABC transporter permease n=1 Tax=Kitasatospora sp. NPDC057223 TaxID=3346055 RepID=UPI00363869F1
MTHTPHSTAARPAPAPEPAAPATGGPTLRKHNSGPRRPTGPVLAAALLALLLLAAAVPGLLAPHSPTAIDPADAFHSPSADHWFGTDESGRDIFTRTVHGARSSFLIGVLATALGLGLALLLGTAAALGGRITDFAIGRLLEVAFAVPVMMLALLLVTAFGGGPTASALAVGLATAPGYARIIRGRVRTVRAAGYVEAATVLGHRRRTVLARHILPNTLSPLLALATLGIGQAVVWACSLSFLGLGAAPPAPEWGAMLAAGRPYLANAWWLTFFPGALIVLSAATVTVLGRTLQRRTREQ